MEFILSSFLNYGFIFISLAFSRGGVSREERKRKEGGREICYRFKEVFVCLFLSCSLSAKIKGFNGSCRDANLIPMEPELRGRVTNTMKTQLEVRATVI